MLPPRAPSGAEQATVRLDGPTDFAGFRREARHLLARGVPPECVSWTVASAAGDLFGESGDMTAPAGAPVRPTPVVPRSFVDLAASAALHGDPLRFGLIYRLLWRMGDEPRLPSLASDPDIARLHAMAKAVRRDIHKMHAFVRFREVTAPEATAYVAWYEPDHHVVEAAAPFFARRFASMVWTILTPERSCHWTGERLVFGPGADQRDAPSEDRLEELWRSYYANVFNPARVNPDAMRAEMPKRFWRNLPEAALIRDLVAEAPARAQAMVAAMPTAPVRRRGAELRASAPSADEPTEGLPGIAAAVQACRACPLHEQATQAVAGEGPASARIMVIGEQPGDSEDIAGRPFVGPAGRVLDKAFAEAGLPRAGLYLTNAVKHFKFEPRGKRRLHKRPSSAEIHACLPLLEREFATVDPALVVMLGASAAQAVLGRTVAVTRERGRPFRLADGRQALLTTHPSYILRLQDEDERRQAFAALVADLRLARELADGAAAQEVDSDPSRWATASSEL